MLTFSHILELDPRLARRRRNIVTDYSYIRRRMLWSGHEVGGGGGGVLGLGSRGAAVQIICARLTLSHTAHTLMLTGRPPIRWNTSRKITTNHRPLQRLLQWVANEGLKSMQCHQSNKDFKTNTAVLKEDKIELIVNQPDNVQIRTKILLAPSSLARLWQVYQPMATHWVASSRSKGDTEECKHKR